MQSRVSAALYLLVMVVVIVGLDVLFLRHHFAARLAVNIGVVVVFVAGYFRFLKRA